MTIDTAKEREYLKSQHGVEGYRYRFADPISGRPVWRYSPGPWNGQRPREAEALYTHSVYLTASAALDAIDAQAAEIERLRRAVAWATDKTCEGFCSRGGRGAFDDCFGCEIFARATIAEREP